VLAHSILIIIAGALWCLQMWFLLRPACLGSLGSQSPLGRAKEASEALVGCGRPALLDLLSRRSLKIFLWLSPLRGRGDKFF